MTRTRLNNFFAPPRDLAKAGCVICLAATALAGCQDEPNVATDTVVRGLKTVLVEDRQQTTVRRYPSVLEPAEVTTLSFETPGKLQHVDLKVGQIVAQGDVLAQLDPRSLELAVEAAQAAAAQAEAAATNAATQYARQAQLLERNLVARVEVDDALASRNSTAAQLEQAQSELATARENLSKADLVSPIDGIINTVEVESFTNVGSGTPVVTLYQADGFEVSLSVAYDVIQKLTVGKQARIRLADNPDIVLAGVVTELGSKADTVSSFPIIIKLKEVRRELKAGMAVEVAMDFPVPTGTGFLLPLSILPFDGQLEEHAGPDSPSNVSIFVFNDADSTVARREVSVGGVKDNNLIVIAGIEAGERVATAGVSFLRDGQKVKLLPDGR